MPSSIDFVSIPERINGLNWPDLEAALWSDGFAETPPILTADECLALSELYSQDIFRSRVDMAGHNYGRGEYKYFANPLPDPVTQLRASLYARLAPIAAAWATTLKLDMTYPDALDEFLSVCHEHGQLRPTPLLLKYGQDDFNCLHQDLYGEIWFPLQGTFFLDEPGVDFTGGEFLLMEQRPRAQSVGHVIQPAQGAAVIFATQFRPARGSRGFYRATLRHGVSRVHSGKRHTLGMIFHDAR